MGNTLSCRALVPPLRKCHDEPFRRNRAKTLFLNYDNTPCENELVAFTAGPTDMGRVGSDMCLSDPPLTEAGVHLCFRHIRTSFVVSIQYSIKRDSPLTFDSLFEEAESSKRAIV